MRVGIVRWQVKKSLQPGQSGNFLYSSGVKTRSVARLKQKMIWQQSLILLKRLPLQCAAGKLVHSFHQDPSPVKKASLRGDMECHRREEESSKLCGGCRKVFHSWLHQPPADCVAHKTRCLVNIQLLHEIHAVRFGCFHADS